MASGAWGFRLTTERSDIDLFGMPTHVILDLAWRDKSLLGIHANRGPKPVIPPSTEEARVCELRLGASVGQLRWKKWP